MLFRAASGACDADAQVLRRRGHGDAQGEPLCAVQRAHRRHLCRGRHDGAGARHGGRQQQAHRRGAALRAGAQHRKRPLLHPAREACRGDGGAYRRGARGRGRVYCRTYRIWRYEVRGDSRLPRVLPAGAIRGGNERRRELRAYVPPHVPGQGEYRKAPHKA